MGYVRAILKGREPETLRFGAKFEISSSNLVDEIADLVGRCGPSLISDILKVLVQARLLDPELEDFVDKELVDAIVAATALKKYELKKCLEDSNFEEGSTFLKSVPLSERDAAVHALKDEMFLGLS